MRSCAHATPPEPPTAWWRPMALMQHALPLAARLSCRGGAAKARAAATRASAPACARGWASSSPGVSAAGCASLQPRAGAPIRLSGRLVYSPGALHLTRHVAVPGWRVVSSLITARCGVSSRQLRACRLATSPRGHARRFPTCGPHRSCGGRTALHCSHSRSAARNVLPCAPCQAR